jgi:hypothetical protein
MAKKKSRRPRGYLQIVEGEWIAPVKRGFVHQCCDCALVHVTDYAVEDGWVWFRTRVDRRLTAAARRKFRFSQEDI